jgi:L-malate glycosyltransferase
VRVLHVNHTALMSGAEHSLLTLIDALPADVSAGVACPPGPLAEAVRDLQLPVHTLRGTDGSLKIHPVHTSRAVAEMARAAVRLRRLARLLGVDVVHANSIRAGIVSTLAARIGGAPAVVHVRDCMPPSPLASSIARLIGSGAAAVVANSLYTESAFAQSGFSGRSQVVLNAVDLPRFDPSKTDRAAARAALELPESTVTLAVVAQLTPWKGQDDAVRTVGLLKQACPDIRLLLVGSAKFESSATRYDNAAFVRSLRRLIDELDLGDEVVLVGERDDIPEILSAVDILLVPSWEEPFGRSISEAMAMGVPVAATRIGGPPELISDGEDGFLLPPRQPERWAAVLEPLVMSRDLRRRMGGTGRARALRRFSAQRHADEMLAVYREAARRQS